MNNKKGISLIVLIITIIVIIILAGAVILSLNNTNMIDNSNTAVNKQNQAVLQSKVTLLLQDVMFDVMEPVKVKATDGTLANAILYTDTDTVEKTPKYVKYNSVSDKYELDAIEGNAMKIVATQGGIGDVPPINDGTTHKNPNYWAIDTNANVTFVIGGN